VLLPFDNDGAAIGEVEPGLQLPDVFGRRVRSGEVVEEETGLEEHVLEDFRGGVDGCELGLDGGFSVGEGRGNLSADEIVSGGFGGIKEGRGTYTAHSAGVKRFTPAAMEASMRAIWDLPPLSWRASVKERTVCTPLRAETRAWCEV